MIDLDLDPSHTCTSSNMHYAQVRKNIIYNSGETLVGLCCRNALWRIFGQTVVGQKAAELSRYKGKSAGHFFFFGNRKFSFFA